MGKWYKPLLSAATFGLVSESGGLDLSLNTFINSAMNIPNMGILQGIELTQLSWTAFKHLLIPDMRRDREVQAQSATNARTIVYGRSRVGNQIAYAETTGSGSEIFHIICLHAGHEIDGYEEIYFDDKLVASADGGWAIQAPYTGKATIEFYDGTQTAACNNLVIASATNSGGWTNDHKLLGVAYTHVTLTYDESVYPSGMPTVKAVLRGKKIYDPRTGKTTWGDNPALCIRDYMLASKNDGGMGCDADELDEAAFLTAANICDELVESMIALDVDYTPAAAGVKALYKPVVGSFEKRYTLNGVIKLDGAPTQFIRDMLTSCGGEAVYSCGVWKIYAAAPSTAVATINESWLNGGISFQTGGGNNDKINTAKGTFTNSNDYWADTEFPQVPAGLSTPPNVDYWSVVTTPTRYNPAAAYTIGQYVLWAGKAYKAYNSVPVNSEPPSTGFWSLIEEHDNAAQYLSGHTVQRGGVVYISVAAVPVSNPYITEDGGEVLTANLSLPFTITSSEAQRLAKIALNKSRLGFTMSYPCNHRAFALDINDVVTVENSRMGMNKLFQVRGWSFSLMGGTSLSLAEYSDDVFSWAPSDSTPLIAPIITNLPDPWTVADPTGLTVVESLHTGNVPSVIMSMATFSWVAGGASSTVYDIYLDGGIYSANYTETTIDMPNMPTGLHTFSVRASNTIGAHSNIISTNATLYGNPATPADVSGFTTSFVGNLVKLSWNPNTEVDLSGYEIRTGTDWTTGTILPAALSGSYRPTASGSITHWIKAKNSTGNYSASAASSVTVVPSADIPTGITATPQFLVIGLSINYDLARQDTDSVEIWAAATNDRTTAALIGVTRDGSYQHSVLNNGVARYYWARCVNVFAEPGAFYPTSATGGVLGATLNEPTEAIKLLNGDISNSKLSDYLSGTGSFSSVVNTFTPAAVSGVGVEGVFATEDQIVSAKITILDDAILLKASNDDLSGQVLILSDMIGLKLDATGTVGPGLAIAWQDETHTKSVIRVQSDLFQVGDNTGSGYRNIFSVGNINGIPTVGVSGDAVIDGTISARSLVADTAMVDFLNAREITAKYVAADWVYAGNIDVANLVGDTITGKTIQTKEDPGTGDRSRFTVSASTNYASFYDYAGVEQVAIGSGTSDAITGTVLVGYYGVPSTSNAIVAFSGSGAGIEARSFSGYSGVFGGMSKQTPTGRVFRGKAQLLLEPGVSGSPASDSTSLAALTGSVYMNLSGDMYIKKITGWKKVLTEA